MPPTGLTELYEVSGPLPVIQLFDFQLSLGISPEMWLRLQARYEPEKVQDESDLDLKDKIPVSV